MQNPRYRSRKVEIPVWSLYLLSGTSAVLGSALPHQPDSREKPVLKIRFSMSVGGEIELLAGKVN